MAPSVVLLSCAAVALLLLHVVEAFPPHDNRIFGGHYINISEVPFQVAMYLDGEYQCGGSIISEQWILSAAHCTFRVNITSLGVRVGSNEHASGGQYYEVEQVVEHKEYNKSTNYDISLLKTSKPIVFNDKVGVARLPAQGAASPDARTELLVSGWGLTDNVNKKASDELKAVHTEVVDFSRCEEEWSRFKPDENLQICTFSFGRNSCVGDSGGPLVVDADRDTVVGVVSYGPTECGSASVVYTKVSSFRDWITEISGV